MERHPPRCPLCRGQFEFFVPGLYSEAELAVSTSELQAVLCSMTTSLRPDRFSTTAQEDAAKVLKTACEFGTRFTRHEGTVLTWLISMLVEFGGERELAMNCVRCLRHFLANGMDMLFVHYRATTSVLMTFAAPRWGLPSTEVLDLCCWFSKRWLTFTSPQTVFECLEPVVRVVMKALRDFSFRFTLSGDSSAMKATTEAIALSCVENLLKLTQDEAHAIALCDIAHDVAHMPQRYPDNATLAQTCMKCMVHFCVPTANKAGMTPLVTTILRSWSLHADDVVVTHKSIACMVQLTVDAVSDRRTALVPAINPALKALRTFPDSVDVVKGCLLVFSVLSIESACTIVDTIPDIRWTLCAFERDSQITASAVRCFANLAANPRFRYLVMDMSADVLAAFTRFPDEIHVVTTCMGFFVNLAVCREYSSKAQECVPDICNALWKHAHDADMAVSILIFFGNMGLDCEVNPLAPAILKGLLAMVNLHVHNAEVCHRAMQCFKEYAGVPVNRAAMRAFVPFSRKAIERYPYSKGMLKHCTEFCGVLGVSVYEPRALRQPRA